jgi:O-Antigen ligase
VWASLSKVWIALLLWLPGALTVYFAFNSGGMFEVTTAFGACVVITAMALSVATAREPLAGLTPRGLLACGSLVLFALWTLLSARWSHATGRALVAFDRVLLYLAVLALFACIPRSVSRFRWMLRGLLFGSAAVSVIGLLSRVLPALWPTGHGLAEERLSYPITYWNTFAFLVGTACILAVHHTCDEHEPPSVRVCAAALLPLLGAALLLTFSRGALGVTVLGVLIYMVIAHPRGLLGGVFAIAPTTAVAVSWTYSAELIQKGTPLTPAAIAQGHHLALTLGLCAIAAALLRALSLALDMWMARITMIWPGSRRRQLIGGLGVVGVALVAFIAVGGPALTHDQYERFVSDTHIARSTAEGPRGRLLYVGNDGRLPLWNVALDVFREDPLEGSGAGTFRLEWERHQSEAFDRVYAYSLYVEVLAELGLVGMVLLGASLLTILVGIAVLASGPGRSAYAAALALELAWTVHAGVDLDWQTPAVSILGFALGGFALAKPRGKSTQIATPHPVHAPMSALTRVSIRWARPLLVFACLAVGVLPARMALAQFHLQSSIEALDAGACSEARDDARDSISELDTGSRPYEVLAICAVRDRDLHAALKWSKSAVESDPRNWETHYVSALVDGIAGVDPSHEAQLAYRLDPLGSLPQLGVRALRGHRIGAWRMAARTLPFFFS